MADDVFGDYDGLLQAAWELRQDPWSGPIGSRRYTADLALLSALLTIPRLAGAKVTSGRFPKAFDAWIAYELRCAGFKTDEVWPRVGRQPRVSTPEMAQVEGAVDALNRELRDAEAVLGTQLKPQSLRRAITAVSKTMPALNTSNILGRFYVKQVDVAIAGWDRGPDVMISSKTQFAKYSANRNNRYEETLGEAANLRDRYPLAAMGYAFIVGSDIFDERGNYARLKDLLQRTRKPDGPYDATMLLVGDVWTPASTSVGIAEKSPNLSAGQFFEDLLRAVVTNTPVGVHEEVRERREGAAPLGGAPDVLVDEVDDDDA